MYLYAILNVNNICHTVLQCDINRDDFADRAIPIDTYDTKYLNALWRDDLNDWEFPPEPEAQWNGTEWVTPEPLAAP